MRLSKSLVAAVTGVIFCAAITFTQSNAVKEATVNGSVEKTKQLKPQTTCPVMTGQPIDKSLYVDYKGKRIYVCDKVCQVKLKKNPEKYLKKLGKMGQEAETIPSDPEQSVVRDSVKGK
jgi:YHS domain-containing protein